MGTAEQYLRLTLCAVVVFLGFLFHVFEELFCAFASAATLCVVRVFVVVLHRTLKSSKGGVSEEGSGEGEGGKSCRC